MSMSILVTFVVLICVGYAILPDQVRADSKLRFLLDRIIYRELEQLSGPGLDGVVAYHVDRDSVIKLAKQDAMANAEYSESQLSFLTQAINRCLDAFPLDDRLPPLFSRLKLNIAAISNQIRECIRQFNRTPLIETCRSLSIAEVPIDSALFKLIFQAEATLLSHIYNTIATEMRKMTFSRQQYVEIIKALFPHFLFIFHEKVFEKATIDLENMPDEVNPYNDFILFIIRPHLLETCEVELKACRTFNRDLQIKKIIVKNVFPEIIEIAKSKNVDPNHRIDIFRNMENAMKLFLTGASSDNPQHLALCRELATRHRLQYPLDLPNKIVTELQNQFKLDLTAALFFAGTKDGHLRRQFSRCLGRFDKT